MTQVIDYLIDDLRLRIGDTDSTAYRFLDEWLVKALESSVKYLGRYWRQKYIIDSDGNVSRNTAYRYFTFDEDTYGVIEQGDDSIIVLVAAILLLQGDFQKSAYGYVSWRDSEISVSMQSAARSQETILQNLIAELDKLLPSPMKRLARALKGSLPGFGTTGSVGFEKTTKF